YRKQQNASLDRENMLGIHDNLQHFLHDYGLLRLPSRRADIFLLWKLHWIFRTAHILVYYHDVCRH
ncbi:hypothetical protein PMAYCL1PPCAC_25971, partial [Pristionchus mayeri]